jgi:DNA-binding PadR family transcriptional regulator
LTQKSTNVLQGTLDLVKGTFKVGPGSLFPALHKMEEAG